MLDFNPSPENGSWDTHVLFFSNQDYVYIPVKWTEILMTFFFADAHSEPSENSNHSHQWDIWWSEQCLGVS